MELQPQTCNPRDPRIRGQIMYADNNKAIFDFKGFDLELLQVQVNDMNRSVLQSFEERVELLEILERFFFKT